MHQRYTVTIFCINLYYFLFLFLFFFAIFSQRSLSSLSVSFGEDLSESENWNDSTKKIYTPSKKGSNARSTRGRGLGSSYQTFPHFFFFLPPPLPPWRSGNCALCPHSPKPFLNKGVLCLMSSFWCLIFSLRSTEEKSVLSQKKGLFLFFKYRQCHDLQSVHDLVDGNGYVSGVLRL